jgi:hypothetical protein
MKKIPKKTTRISLAPLTPEQALHIALNTSIPKSIKKKNRKRR